MSDYLPHDVVTEILLRLPVKSLIRFSVVCKRWKSLFETSGFIARRRNQEYTNLLLFKVAESTDRCLLRSPETGESKCLILPRLLLDRRSIIAHGALMLIFDSRARNDDSSNFFICNPSIRRFVDIDDGGGNEEGFTTYYDFGYDTLSLDYKVLRVLIDESGEEAPWGVSVYSLATAAWKPVDAASNSVPSCYVGSLDSGVLLNNSLHWFLQSSSDDRDHVILAFDMHNEVYDFMAVPDHMGDNIYKEFSELRWDRTSVSQYAGLLAVVNVSITKGVAPSGRVWVMNDYGVKDSWTLLHHVRLQGLPEQCLGPLGLTRNGDIVVDLLSAGLFYIKNGETIRLDVEGSFWGFNDYFVESLVLLDRENAISY